MIDYARITVKAGDGGNGAGSFHKIKGRRYGKADGGDGGKGGDVYVEASADLNALDNFRFVKDYKAQSGQNGLSRRRRGAVGEDLVLKVPIGTQIKLVDDRFQIIDKKQMIQHPESMIYDLTQDAQRILVARAGEGGRGNLKLKDEFGRRPRDAERGEEGETINLTLELKLIADVGLIGLPNAGKSTFLTKITRAKVPIANYPFTTLEPNLGVFEPSLLQDQNVTKGIRSEKRVIIADIPGLIEGASEGRGLGDLFLRHIERTGVLVHMIDVSTQSDKWQDYQTIREELKKYSRDLSKKSEIIALCKIDLAEESYVDKVVSVFKNKRKKIFPISNETGEGIEALVSQVIHYLHF